MQDGDKILDINGVPYESLNDLSSGNALLSSDGYYTVDRDGERMKITIPRGFINSFSDEESMSNFISIRFPFKILEVNPEGTAVEAGIQKGDEIVAVNEQPIQYFNELQDALAVHKGETVALTIVRDQQEIITNTEVLEDGTIGIAAENLIEPVRKNTPLQNRFHWEPKGLLVW